MGLVDEVVEPDQLLARAEQIAQTIAAMAPLAVRDSIRAVNAGYDLPLPADWSWKLRSLVLPAPPATRRKAREPFSRSARRTGAGNEPMVTTGRRIARAILRLACYA